MKLGLSRQISKNPQTTYFMKIHLLGTALFRADGRKGRRDEAVACRSVANSPNSIKNIA